jgi:hypothetical protein
MTTLNYAETQPPYPNLGPFGGSVTVAGVDLNGLDTVNGVRYVVEDIVGWWNLPDASVPDYPKSIYDDGNIYIAGRFGARTISISGRAIPVNGTFTAAQAAAVRDQLNRSLDIRGFEAVASNQTINVTVDEWDGSKTAVVQLSARPQVTVDDERGTVKFQVTLSAPDPRKYSTSFTGVEIPPYVAPAGRGYNRSYNYTYGELGSSGIVTITNFGDAPGRISMQVQGPITRPRVENQTTGEFIQFVRNLGTGTVVSIDNAAKTINTDATGTTNRRDLISASSSWITLVPGDNTLIFRGDGVVSGSAARLRIIAASAWWE